MHSDESARSREHSAGAKLWLNVSRFDQRQRRDLPFSQAGEAALFQLLTRPCEHTSLMITTKLDFAACSRVFGDVEMTTALLDRLTHHCHIVETGNESIRFSRNTAEAKKRIKAREQTRKTTKPDAEADPF